jgi:hypothetical protein
LSTVAARQLRGEPTNVSAVNLTTLRSAPLVANQDVATDDWYADSDEQVIDVMRVQQLDELSQVVADSHRRM